MDPKTRRRWASVQLTWDQTALLYALAQRHACEHQPPAHGPCSLDAVRGGIAGRHEQHDQDTGIVLAKLSDALADFEPEEI